MAFRGPGNVQGMKVSKFRDFNGLGGPIDRVLKRTNYKGWDISNGVANELMDLECREQGSIILRAGCRKISDTGIANSITNIFQVTLGGKRRFAYVAGGNLTIEDMPEWIMKRQPSFTLDPIDDKEAVSTIYPAASPEMPI